MIRTRFSLSEFVFSTTSVTIIKWLCCCRAWHNLDTGVRSPLIEPIHCCTLFWFFDFSDFLIFWFFGLLSANRSTCNYSHVSTIVPLRICNVLQSFSCCNVTVCWQRIGMRGACHSTAGVVVVVIVVTERTNGWLLEHVLQHNLTPKLEYHGGDP